MKFTGRNGELRIYDGSEIVAGGAQANMSVFVYVSIGSTFTDKTTEAYADDISYTGTFWVNTGDKVYVGRTVPFARIKFLQGGGVLGIAAGALTIKYYNGSSWVAITDKNDGTASGGHTFAQDGYIDFKVPSNWALRGDASLSATHYYIELTSAALPSTEPSADILAPVDGQYQVVGFANMDFNGPIGRPRQEEVLVLDRDTMSSTAHYVQGSDEKIYEPLPVTFSCILDDTVNQDYVFDALACGNPGAGSWTATGVTTKGDTKNDASNYNPAFADATNKKAVDIIIQWDTDRTSSTPNGLGLYEVYFPLEEQSIVESADGITLNCNGAIYGVIETAHELADRY